MFEKARANPIRCVYKNECVTVLYTFLSKLTAWEVYIILHWAIYTLVELHERLLYKREWCFKCLNTRIRELHHCATVNDAVSIARARFHIKMHCKQQHKSDSLYPIFGCTVPNIGVSLSGLIRMEHLWKEKCEMCLMIKSWHQLDPFEVPHDRFLIYILLE